MIPDPTNPLHTRQVPEADCIALVAWIDNRIESLTNWRSKITASYMPKRPSMFMQNEPTPKFTLHGLLQLFEQNGSSQRTLNNVAKQAMGSVLGKLPPTRHPLQEAITDQQDRDRWIPK